MQSASTFIRVSERRNQYHRKLTSTLSLLGVKVGNSFSGSVALKSGVPQGTVLGPLLFILYMNDCEKVLKFSNIALFADDCKIYKPIYRLEDHHLLQQDLDSFFEWCKIWQLNLAAEKCCFHSIGYRWIDTSYEIGGVGLEYEVC